MKPGIYEHLVTQALEQTLKELTPTDIHKRYLNEANESSIYSEHLKILMTNSFSRLSKKESFLLFNKIAELVTGNNRNNLPREKSEELLSISSKEPIPRPDISMAFGALLTGSQNDPTLVSQLIKEMASANKVSILCSFIKWSGIRVIKDAILQFTSQEQNSLRIITTSYMAATDIRALDWLYSLPNTEVKVSYDSRRTRLHAKAYCFERNTKLGSAYVGSANISSPAMTEGLEWVFKISEKEQEYIWEKVIRSFESYWSDAEFQEFNHEQFKAALSQEKNKKSLIAPDKYIFRITPFPYQREILEKLDADRNVLEHKKNLIVAATGTGKTVIAAFDYKRFLQKHPKSKLLFIAHRKEILEQSLACFRGVLMDMNFGDLFIGGNVPKDLGDIFASIQSLNSREIINNLDPDFYDFIIVDETHHAGAFSYGKILDHFKPKILLGLTATPERADSKDILHYFDNRIAAEIRLPDAINRRLLCPFQYFGLSDSVDLSGVSWTRGGYDNQQLTNILDSNNQRATLVIQQTQKYLLNTLKASGLGFCVSIKHAKFMAKMFTQAGIPSACLTSEEPPSVRGEIQEKLKKREINFIFTVDIYNEGVDLPFLDTILLLRPTESLTIFLQQLGRGLRLYDKKDCLTVLDFVAKSNRRFRFADRFKALLGRKKQSIKKEVIQNFPNVPFGCSIILEKVAKEHVLENINRSLDSVTKRNIIDGIKNWHDYTDEELTISNFLSHNSIEPGDLYKRKTSWAHFIAAAANVPYLISDNETELISGLSRFAKINDKNWITSLLAILTNDFTISTQQDYSYLNMLHCSIWSPTRTFSSLKEANQKLLSNPSLVSELLELLKHRLNSSYLFNVKPKTNQQIPFVLHANYSRKEILAGFGKDRLLKRSSNREGVCHVSTNSLEADIFMITLSKSEAEFSPTTMYKDYAITSTLFHWQSQSTTSDSSNTFKRYKNHNRMGSEVYLFVRGNKNSTYDFLGPADFVKAEGSRPVSIIWKLRTPMPASIEIVANDLSMA